MLLRDGELPLFKVVAVRLHQVVFVRESVAEVVLEGPLFVGGNLALFGVELRLFRGEGLQWLELRLLGVSCTCCLPLLGRLVLPRRPCVVLLVGS